jgi:cytochrome P450
MTTAIDSIHAFHPTSPEYLLDPGAALQTLLRDRPAFYHEASDAYYVLPYAEVRQMLGDSDRYSNRKSRNVPVREELRAQIPPHVEQVAQLMYMQINALDPPEHTPRRKLAQQTFSHRRMRNLEPQIHTIANDVIDGLVDRGSCDLMGEYSSQVTIRVIAALLDLPAEILPQLTDWVKDLFQLQVPIDTQVEDVSIPDDELVALYQRLYAAYRTYIALVEERVAHPGDDLPSALLQMRDADGNRLVSNDDVLAFMIVLTVAGSDTTANLITNMVRLFTEAPDELARVQADPALWPNAVAEGLRRSGIAAQRYRISRVPSEVLGMEIPAGVRVGLHLAAANTDPEKFPDPLRFDVLRPNAADHLGLSRGRHYCLGAPVVMPEAQIALATLYARLPGLSADLTPPPFYPTMEQRAIISQPVSWDTTKL